MTVPRTDPAAFDRRPLHERIAADLRDQIMSGVLAPGARIPSTVQLKERFEASGASVQKALQLLKDEGLAVGRAGASVTVRAHRQHTLRPASSLAPASPGAPYPWLTEAGKEGSPPGRSTLLEVATTTPPADVAEVLNLPVGTEQCVVRRQLLSLDEEPAELVASYYPLDIARGTALMERRKIRGGTPALLTELGFPPRRSVDRVSARVPTQDQCTALRLPGNLPVLRTLRVVHSETGRPVEATVMVKAGHLYEVQYEFAVE
ncbi:GntR family transcriptional regulator [Streptomyces sp. NPDC046716]|uniref:GntR family transcriptional regulator n=1 Tax=Streptomyces sp. NPDC046716 TaxID=3157093 RepID=UPI0033E0CA6D